MGTFLRESRVDQVSLLILAECKDHAIRQVRQYLPILLLLK